MNKKLIKHLLTAPVLAGTLLAGSINSYAQSSGSPRPADNGNAGSATPAPTPNQPITRTPPPPSGPVNQSPPATILPILPGDYTPPANPSTRPISPGGDRTIPGAVIPGSPGNGSTRTPPAGGGVVYVGPPAQLTPLPSGAVIPPSSTVSNSGVRVVAGDVVRTLPDSIAPGPTPTTGTPTPVTTLVERFDTQRAQELAIRDATLAQLRTASPAQREALIAEMQAATQRQATEQREAARELRRELRTMREERKGK